MEERFMERAIELSMKGIGFVNPNPLVGAVIVKDGKVIGEGYHEFYGGPHAEVNAFKSAAEDVRGATMYVTLEPCSHHGKTPPCADEIVRRGIKRVVIGMEDPNPIVAGRGVKILRDNGIDVVVGVLENEVKKLNEIFIKYIATKEPFCILKTAMTLDGKIATKTGDSKWISSDESRKLVHSLRQRVAAIMVGIGTVLKDDPMLTTRLEEGREADPVRVVIDSSGRIPLSAKVLNLKSDSKTIIAVTEKANKDKINALREMGAEIIIAPMKNDRVDLKHIIIELGKMGIDSILLEGGSTLNYSALNDGIVDKVISFIAPKIIGGEKAKTPVGGEGKDSIKEGIVLKDLQVTRIGSDVLIEAYPDRGE